MVGFLPALAAGDLVKGEPFAEPCWPKDGVWELKILAPCLFDRLAFSQSNQGLQRNTVRSSKEDDGGGTWSPPSIVAVG